MSSLPPPPGPPPPTPPPPPRPPVSPPAAGPAAAGPEGPGGPVAPVVPTPPPAPAPAAPAAEERRWHYRRSLASRVTLLTTFAVGLAVAFVAVGAYVTVRMQLQSTLDDSLVQRATSAARSDALAQITDSYRLPSWALGASDVRIGFLYSSGHGIVLDQGPKLPVSSAELAVANGRSGTSLRTVSSGGRDYRMVAVPTTVPGQALVIAQPLDSQQRVLERLGWVMLLFGAAGVIAAAMAGWGVARNGLRPVRRLTGAVEHIARTEDLTPLPVEGDDEIARLATAFNMMLTALAASRDRQRQLVVDAGHELRTPLTSLRTNLDLLAQIDDSAAPGGAGGPALPPQARAELLDDVRAQIEELTTLIGDLVELARDEPLTHVVEEVDLSEVADRAVGRVRRRAPGVTFEVRTSPWWVEGEPAALERAVTNLLDNAAKWSPAGGTVTVSLDHGVLTVDDAGPGIADADLPHVFDRFYRSQESRSMPGSGLGLSIVRAVASRHAGSVAAGASPAGGARLTLWLPGRPAPRHPSYDEQTVPIAARPR
ncbi:sensor histidine kinase [Nocardioides panaciterrulae]|uniref:histidine kinase n=1 Tax=Nocardioides panaciterrulae TaxID=661492 RepID=A0A7Y9J932_9ACTN|nr:HAMP domain-containing sensor histidine kinase [Nocardioides panaciterrulae]NYD40177.1 two-component system sensor histidine kinase MprB [Nocardioides panaciterrulae]